MWEKLQMLIIWSEICLFWYFVIFCSGTSEKEGKTETETKGYQYEYEKARPVILVRIEGYKQYILF